MKEEKIKTFKCEKWEKFLRKRKLFSFERKVLFYAEFRSHKEGIKALIIQLYVFILGCHLHFASTSTLKVYVYEVTSYCLKGVEYEEGCKKQFVSCTFV